MNGLTPVPARLNDIGIFYDDGGYVVGVIDEIIQPGFAPAPCGLMVPVPGKIVVRWGDTERTFPAPVGGAKNPVEQVCNVQPEQVTAEAGVLIGKKFPTLQAATAEFIKYLKVPNGTNN